MSYEKAMKHSHNHHKDRFYQQCGFSFRESVRSYAAVAEDTAESYYVAELATKTKVSPNFADSDDAVDFLRDNGLAEQNKYGIFTDKGMLIMKERKVRV